jgi:hypothetical protein
MALLTQTDSRGWMATLRRHGGLLLACLLAAGLVGLHYRLRQPDGRGFTISSLQGFDAYVYLAAAEHPQVFTVAPWGYRVLAPWLAHLIRPEKPMRGFKWLTLWTTALAAVLLFLFLRRLGFSSVAGLIGLGLFCLSPPVGALLANPFSTEGPGIALANAFLLGVAGSARLPILLLLLALGFLTKDIFVLLTPLLYGVLRRSVSRERALVTTVAVALAMLALAQVLRLYWTPQIVPERPILDGQLLALLREDARLSGPSAALASLLGGLVPLALLGALRRAARPWLARYGYLLLATLALPFMAWLNVPARRPFGFFGDVPRLHIYALPLLIPLALLALGRLIPRIDAVVVAPATVRRRPFVDRACSIALVGVLAFPFLAVDRYRRYPLHTRREGPQILMTCRRTLAAAAQIERGEAVVYPVSAADTGLPAAALGRRWYLTEEWDDDAYAPDAPLTLRLPRASLLVPCLTPRDLEIVLRLHASRPALLACEINGHALGALRIDALSESQLVRVPAAFLFRGDNLLTLTRGASDPPVVFEELVLRPLGSPPVR